MSLKNMRFIIEKYKRIVAWGAGKYFEQYHYLLNGQISYLVDCNVVLQGRERHGIRIFPPSKLEQERYKEECLIVVFNARFREIADDAKKIGDFDIIDIKALELLYQRTDREDTGELEDFGKTYPVLVCAGMHALWGINGSRKFIDTQNEILHSKGLDTLEVVPLPYYEKGDCRHIFIAISRNGRFFGTFLLDEFVKSKIKTIGVIIHSLYYSHEVLDVLLKNMEIEHNILYYVHDYYCICANRFLYVKEMSCLDSRGELRCQTCFYREQKELIFNFHRRLFSTYGIKLIVPSWDTEKRIKEIFNSSEVRVIPHLSYQAKQQRKQKYARKIAYIGSACRIKGWDGYKTIVERLGGKYKFYCLGRCDTDNYIEGVTYVEIDIKGENDCFNMIDSLKKYEIDIVYLNSVCPETFSYTYYEAYEAGCFVLTGENSGNICDQVKKQGNGLVFETIDDMVEWLDDVEEAENIVLQMHKAIADVQPDETFLGQLWG
ncbi:MAG: glycosyltransferase [Hungatella sp.]|jgi:hypothetical protein|nr:glycosyltransferase [Hungatella sp.]